MHRATCDECGKVYRVADAGRTHRCKACGGAVRVSVKEAEESAIEAILTCPSCAAPNRSDARFCKACGAALAERGSATDRTPKDELERTLATRELTSTFDILRTLRFLYVIFAVLALLALAASIWLVLRQAPTGGDVIADVELPWIRWGFGLALAAVYVVGAWKVVSQPFVWSLILASLTTLNAVVGLLQSGIGLWNSFGIGLAALLWAAVPPASRVQRLLREFPDLLAARRLKGERLTLDREKLAARTNPRAVEARKLAARRTALSYLGGGAAFVALVAIAWVWSKGTERPAESATTTTLPAFEPVAAKFIETWNASKHDEIVPFFQGRYQELRRRQLKSVFTRRHWDQKLPTIGWPTVSAPKEARFRTNFPLVGQPADTCLVTIWAVHDGKWDLDTLKFPD
jgi:zinc ribbon protein